MEQPQRQVLWVDALLALAAAGLCLSVLAGPATWRPDGSAWLLVAIHAGALALRRIAPRRAFVIGISSAAVYLAIGEPMVGLTLAPVVMMYSFGAAVPRRVSLVGLAVAEAVLVLHVLDQQYGDGSTFVGNALVLAAAWLVGDSAFRRRAHARAEVTTAADRAAVEERVRIAHEMHDVVAHSMSLIVVRAGAGRLAIDDDPAEAKRALTVIEDTGRAALSEMRHLLGVLRADEPAPTAPLPSLMLIDQLVADATRAGTPVDLKIEGERRPLPAGVDATAYRAVQEALTNVRRHSPGTAVRVRVAYGRDEIDLEIVNERPVGPSPSIETGRGLVFMRERIEASGGTLDAGPTDAGGFRLRARLPERTPV